MTVVVELSWPEVRRAMYVGVDRFVNAARKDRVGYHGVPRDFLGAHLWGALGELAVAKKLGLYWPTDDLLPDRGRPDVGPFHVRAVSTKDGRLILHREDDDAGVYVLVVPDRLPRLRLVGWCYGREGKAEAYWQTFTGRPCYFVPAEVLRPFEDRTFEAAS